MSNSRQALAIAPKKPAIPRGVGGRRLSIPNQRPPLLGERGELLAKSEFDDRLLASASKKGRNTAKEDRREFEKLPHNEAHSARRFCSIPD
jgi:hypothetical protein